MSSSSSNLRDDSAGYKSPPGLKAAHAEALDHVYRSYWHDLCRFIQARFGSGPPEPEEIAQVAFERLMHVKSFENMENPRGYLFSVASNVARDLYRRARIETAMHYDMAYRNRDVRLSEITPENVLDSKQRLFAFKRALTKMPLLRRRIFLFVRMEGLSVFEVAQMFHMSEGAVYKHVSRAMRDCIVELNKLKASE